MSRQYWSETLAWATASGVAVANSTVETIVMPNVTLPSNYMQDGRTLHVFLAAQYSTTGTPTLTFRLRWGGVAGTVLCASAACTTPSGVTAAMFFNEIWISTRSNGATGTLMVNGIATVCAAVAGTVASATGNSLTTPMTAGGVITPAAVTVDLTADTALSITAQWSAASAANTLTGLQYIITGAN